MNTDTRLTAADVVAATRETLAGWALEVLNLDTVADHLILGAVILGLCALVVAFWVGEATPEELLWAPTEADECEAYGRRLAAPGYHAPIR